MSRTGFLVGLAGVGCATLIWFTRLHADEESTTAALPDQVTQLLARIEKLERRVEALENKQQATRQIDSLFSPAGGWLMSPPAVAKPAPAHGALLVPPKTETPTPPALRSFLPRQIELKPE